LSSIFIFSALLKKLNDKKKNIKVTQLVMNMTTTNRVITIEGNIGSGKTTLLTHLKKQFNNNPNVVFLREPVDEWESIKDAEGTSMLQKFYADQEKYSFPFQMMAYISRLALLKEAMKKHPGAIIITERSLYTDKFVFAKMLHDMNKIEDVNYQIYTKWFDAFAQECPIHQCVYVKTDPDVCHERILKRSRTGEDSIPLDYLTSCDEYHKSMLLQISPMFERGAQDIVVLDGNVDIYSCPEEIDNWIDRISKLIQYA
jgi:deoxyadenosine/deoxycytidine kinase